MPKFLMLHLPTAVLVTEIVEQAVRPEHNHIAVLDLYLCRAQNVLRPHVAEREARCIQPKVFHQLFLFTRNLVRKPEHLMLLTGSDWGIEQRCSACAGVFSPIMTRCERKVLRRLSPFVGLVR